MTSNRHARDRSRRLLGVATGALVVLVWSSTSPTLSAWTAGVVGNPANTAAPASVTFSHSFGTAGTCALGPRVSGTATCAGSVLPTAASTTGTVTGTDAITNAGTAGASALTASVRGASCAAVQLGNTRAPSDVMLPRYGTAFNSPGPFGGTNAITLDGTGYAAAVTQDQMRSAAGETYALGAWFKAGSGQSGPLLSLDTSPVNSPTGNGDDRTLFLGADGKLNVVYGTGGAKLTTSASYNDGAWHFAYATLAVNPLVGLTNTVSLSVDGGTPVTATGLFGYNTVNGYWHLGWGSTALTGGSTAYFTGSLSNLVAFNSGTAPARPTALQLASQSAFTTWASGASDHWVLGDSGTTTYTGTQPVIGSTSPCTYLNVVWSFTGPAATAVTSRSLAAFATGASFPVGAVPGPGVTQTSSIAITRAGSYNAYVAGLRLYVPVTYEVRAGGTWPLTFTWSDKSAVVLG